VRTRTSELRECVKSLSESEKKRKSIAMGFYSSGQKKRRTYESETDASLKRQSLTACKIKGGDMEAIELKETCKCGFVHKMTVPNSQGCCYQKVSYDCVICSNEVIFEIRA
jgi:hypothetical protein